MNTIVSFEACYYCLLRRYAYTVDPDNSCLTEMDGLKGKLWYRLAFGVLLGHILLQYGYSCSRYILFLYIFMYKISIYMIYDDIY